MNFPILKNKKDFSGHSRQGGFLVIELIVAITIFGIVMSICIGSLIMVVDSNRKVQALQSVLNNLQITLDSVTKTLAAGHQYYCGEDSNFNDTLDCSFEDTASDHYAISFISNENLDGESDTCDAMIYRFNAGTDEPEDGFVERQRYVADREYDVNGLPIGCGSWQSTEDWVRMTAPEVNIVDLKFFVTGSTPGAPEQPKVSIVAKGDASSGPRGERTSFLVQTLVTQLIPD